MSQPQNRNRSMRRRRQHRGGDASNWAQAVYGPAGSQTSLPGTNLIAANNLSGVNMCSGGVAANAAPLVSGGSTVAVAGPVASPASAVSTAVVPQKGGRGLLTDVAVPAVLLYANQVVYPRKKKGGRTKCKRRSKRQSRRQRR